MVGEDLGWSAATASGDDWRPEPLPTRETRATSPSGGEPPASHGRVISHSPADPLFLRNDRSAGAANDGREQAAALMRGAATQLRQGLERFADATIAISTRADVPTRVAALDIPGKIGASAAATVDLSGRLVRTARDGLKASGVAAGPLVSAMGERARAIGHRAGEGLGQMSREAVEQVRRVSGTEPITPPESQLARLLAEDEQRVHDPSPAALSMPLFAQAVAGEDRDGERDSPNVAGVAGASSDTPSSDGSADAPRDANVRTEPPSSRGTTSPREPTPPRPPVPPPPPPTMGGRGDWWRHPATWLLGGALLFTGGLALGRQLPGADRVATERVVREYLIAHPEVIAEALTVGRTRQHAAAIADNRARLVTPFSGAWAGAADGDVTLVMFTDYRCGYCRASLPIVERLLREDGRLKVVFRELPILSADSEAAARLALAAAKRGRYMMVHRALFTSADAEGRRRVAIASEVPNDATALSDPSITAELQQNIDLARAIGVDGTPAWVVGDQLISGAVPFEQLKSAVAAARARRD